jgi:hypothetical protein
MAVPPGSKDLPLWQYAAAIGVPSIPFLVVFLRWHNLSPDGQMPSFGDSVNMINAFLASAAFAAVLLTLLLQRKDLHQQTQQFQESMQMQVLATYLSVVDSRRELIASKPMLTPDVDVRSLHQALAMFQFSRYLDRIEDALEKSSLITLDDEHVKLLLHMQRTRTAISRIATLDATRCRLVEEDWSDGALDRLCDWLKATAKEECLPPDVRQQVQERVDSLGPQLAGLRCRTPGARIHGPLAEIDRELTDLRARLVAAVRLALV